MTRRSEGFVVYLFDPGFRLWVMTTPLNLIQAAVRRWGVFFDDDRVPVCYTPPHRDPAVDRLAARVKDRIELQYLLLDDLVEQV